MNEKSRSIENPNLSHETIQDETNTEAEDDRPIKTPKVVPATRIQKLIVIKEEK